MSNPANHKYTPKSIVEEKILFSIPIYQRLFEWAADNVIQLLNDLDKSFTRTPESDYYIGMLTATSTRDAYKLQQLVDGQQRFTVLTLIACVFQDYYPLWKDFLVSEDDKVRRLHFISRKDDEAYLLKLINREFSYEGEIVNPQMKTAIMAISDYMKEYTGDKSAFSEYVYEHLSFFISELPDNYAPQDLNKYFERMNSSGKNLEQHEILKVKLLTKLDGNIGLYMQLWNKIADVDTLLIRKRDNNSETEFDFSSRKNVALNLSLDRLVAKPELINGLKNESEQSGKSIIDIGSSSQKPKDIVHTNNGSRGVLRFPQLLLQVLYYYLCKKGLEGNIIRLDDFFNQNNLLDTFQKYLPYEEGTYSRDDIKEFLELLLHCRVALDVCFIRSLEYGYSLDMNLPEENESLKELSMFESFLYVSSSNLTNYRWFGWLMKYMDGKTSVPDAHDLFCHLKKENDAENTLPDYDELNFTKEIRYWFWRLDFYIWQHRKELFPSEDDYDLLTIADNYVFIRNRSIEHIAPQHPKTESKLQWEENNETDKKLLNSFGNLVMISQSLNSALSNSSYEEKKAHVESYFQSVNGTIESLKLLMVYKDYKSGWNKETIEPHGRKMYELLKNEITLKENKE